MTFEEAYQFVKENWAKLPHRTIEGHEAVWFMESDLAGSYETDEEHVGIKGDGTFVWAYASGCSCWSGDYDTAVVGQEKEMKAFKFRHENVTQEWQEALIKFVSAIPEEALR